MTLQNDAELAATRRKLRDLEAHYEARRGEPAADDPHLRELSLHSLKRRINQLKEEIIWYEAHQPTGR